MSKQNKKKPYEIENKKQEWIYICSPLRSTSSQGLENNMHAAKKYMDYASNTFHKRAMAVHAYLPHIFHDDVPFERELALKLGLDVLGFSKELFVCGNKISEGMKGEIAYAARDSKHITVFNKEIYNEVLMIVAESGSRKFSVSLDEHNPILATPCEVLGNSCGCPM